jgi:hypothetical protein
MNNLFRTLTSPVPKTPNHITTFDSVRVLVGSYEKLSPNYLSQERLNPDWTITAALGQLTYIDMIRGLTPAQQEACGAKTIEYIEYNIRTNTNTLRLPWISYEEMKEKKGSDLL